MAFLRKNQLYSVRYGTGLFLVPDIKALYLKRFRWQYRVLYWALHFRRRRFSAPAVPVGPALSVFPISYVAASPLMASPFFMPFCGRHSRTGTLKEHVHDQAIRQAFPA